MLLGGAAPGALRFLEGAGAWGAASVSGYAEKLDMPGRLSLDIADVVALGSVAWEAIEGFEGRRVLGSDSLSSAARLCDDGAAAPCIFFPEAKSKSASCSRSSA